LSDGSGRYRSRFRNKQFPSDARAAFGLEIPLGEHPKFLEPEPFKCYLYVAVGARANETVIDAPELTDPRQGDRGCRHRQSKSFTVTLLAR